MISILACVLCFPDTIWTRVEVSWHSNGLLRHYITTTFGDSVSFCASWLFEVGIGTGKESGAEENFKEYFAFLCPRPCPCVF